MPLPTNYSRPSLPYVPLQSLPNDRRFVNLTTLQQPPTAEMVDAELNAILDKINTLAGAVNEVVAGNIPGSDNPDNAGKFLVTDGAGNLSFILAGSDNIALNAISTALLQNQAVTQAKIGDGAVGLDQLAVGAVNISKMISTGHKCLLAGREGNNSYYELAPNNQTQPWYVFCNNPNAGVIALNSLVDIWNQTPYTFTGAKLTNGTVNGTALTNGSVAGVKLTDTSVPLSKMVASGNKCLLTGSTGSNAYTEKVADNIAQPWYVFCNNPNAASIALNSLVDVWQNTPYTFTGSQLTNASVTLNKLAQEVLTAIRNNAFASATVSANGTLLRNINVASVTRLSLGQYRVTFASQPPSGSTNYNVQVSIGGEYSCSWTNKTLNSVEVHIYTTAQYYDAPFDIMISDAYA